MPMYFLGGRNVGTVRRMNVGGKLGVCSLRSLRIGVSHVFDQTYQRKSYTTAALTARWLM